MSIKTALASVRSGIAAAPTRLSGSLVTVFVFFAVGAAVLSIIEATNAKATSDLGYWRLLFLGLAAILAELLGLKNMIIAWWEARAVKSLAWCAIWAVGFGFSLYGAFYAAGSFQQQREGIQKAAHVKDANAEEQLLAARAERKRIEQRMTWMNAAVNGKPVRTVEAAEADIKNMKLQRPWEVTEGCTDIKGANTRKFCDTYTTLTAERSIAIEKATLPAELDRAKAEIEKYEKLVASGAQITTSDQTPFVQAMSMAGVPAKAAQFLEPMQAALTNMLLVSLAGLVLGLAAVEGKPRTPWLRFNWIALTARLRRAWDGTDHTQIIDRTVTRYRDPVTGVLRTGAAA